MTPRTRAADSAVPQHYKASQAVTGSGPLSELGSLAEHPIAFAYWRAGAVDRVEHVNDAHPTILFHAAGGEVVSEKCNRFKAGGSSWPGEAMLVPVGADVNCRWREPVEYFHVYFRPGFIEQVRLGLDGGNISELGDRSHVRDPRFISFLKRVLRSSWSMPPDLLLMESLALDLAAETLRTFSAVNVNQRSFRKALTPSRLRRVIERIETSIDQPLGISELAEAAGLSPSHFTRSFRSDIGCTPYQFVLQRRIERAKHLMSDKELSLECISRRAGFSSPSHLSSIFRQETGITPRSWRKLT